MTEIQFLVQGSSAEPYRVTFQLKGTNLTALCTCGAGRNGLYCKHRFSILSGSAKDVISDNAEKVALVADWLPGTDVEAALQKVSLCEESEKQAKANLKTAKKLLAKAMRD